MNTATEIAEISPAHARALRMAALMLAPTREVAGPAEIGQWFGAMQAQDLTSGKWAFGVRLPGATESTVDSAIARGEVLRTWPMRGTVHFVPAADASWMVELMASRGLARAATLHRFLDLQHDHFAHAAAVLDEALRGGGRLPRSACLALLREAGIPTEGQRGYHLLVHLAQTGLLCMGPNEGKEATFTLLAEWAVPLEPPPERAAALQIMAHRYFRSHGPAGEVDLAGWMGMPLSAARAGIAGLGDELARVRCAGQELLMPRAALADADRLPSAHAVLALPAFDEFLLGYKDRSLQLATEHRAAVVPGNNGVFQPTLVRNGQVIGLWRRTVRTRRVELRPTLFAGEPTGALRREVTQALTRFAEYLGLAPDIRWQ